MSAALVACDCGHGSSLLTLIVAVVVGAGASLISVAWEHYLWAFSWTWGWSVFFYGLYVGAGAFAAAALIGVFLYLFGGAPEGTAAAVIAGVGFGAAGAAALRADLSRVPEAGESLNLLRELGGWATGGLGAQITKLAPSRLWRTDLGPFVQWTQYAMDTVKAKGMDGLAAPVLRVDAHLSTLTSPYADEEGKRRAVDGIVFETYRWVAPYHLERPLERPKSNP